MRKLFKRLEDGFFEVFFMINDYHIRLCRKKEPRPMVRTKIGSYFEYWQAPIDTAMNFLSMKDNHRVSQAFMDIVEGDKFKDENGVVVIEEKVDEDIDDLVWILVTLYKIDVYMKGTLRELMKAFNMYYIKNKKNYED